VGIPYRRFCFSLRRYTPCKRDFSPFRHFNTLQRIKCNLPLDVRVDPLRSASGDDKKPFFLVSISGSCGSLPAY